MFKMTISVSKDRHEASIDLSSKSLKLDAAQMDEVIRQLAWLRAGMQPAHEPADLKPETKISNVPAVRWQATEDSLHGQCRLFLLHPGFGWLYVPLDRAAFDSLSAKCRIFLQARPSSLQ